MFIVCSVRIRNSYKVLADHTDPAFHFADEHEAYRELNKMYPGGVSEIDGYVVADDWIWDYSDVICRHCEERYSDDLFNMGGAIRFCPSCGHPVSQI